MINENKTSHYIAKKVYSSQVNISKGKKTMKNVLVKYKNSNKNNIMTYY